MPKKVTTQYIAMESEKNIRTWVPKEEEKKLPITRIKGLVELETPYSETGLTAFFHEVKNNDGDTRYYGKSYFTLAAIQLPFLQACKKEPYTQEKQVIELGCAEGKVVWKALLAGAKVYANELSTYEMASLDRVVGGRVSHKQSNLVKLNMDAFEILQQNPEIKGTFDLLYSQNVLHLFAPAKALDFVKLTYDLLKPGGVAFITTNSIQFYHYETFAKFLENKEKGYDFPGHMRHIVSIVSNNKKPTSIDVKLIGNAEENEHSDLEEKITSSGSVKTVIKHAVQNVFDIESLSGLFVGKGFHLIDAFYMNDKGEKFENLPEISELTDYPEVQQFYQDVILVSIIVGKDEPLIIDEL